MFTDRETLLDHRVRAALVELHLVTVARVVHGPRSTIDQWIRNLKQELITLGTVFDADAGDDRPSPVNPSDPADEIIGLAVEVRKAGDT